MIEKVKNMSDVSKILIAMLLGSVVGILVGEPAAQIGFIGTIWMNMMRMFLVPIVIVMLVKGITSMDNPKTLGRIGIWFLFFYTLTNIVAAAIGVLVTKIFKPGVGFDFTFAGTDSIKIESLPSVGKFFTDMFSKNIFASFSEGNMMQVLIIAVLIGVAIVLLPEEKRKPVRDLFVSMADLVMSLINIALKIAPIGVFCLMADTLGKYGPSLLLTMSKMIGIFYLACAIHIIFVYCLVLWLFTGINPFSFVKKSVATIVAAFSTCSSQAIIPVNINVAKNSFDVKDYVSSLGIPLGATMNKDGTSILCGVVMIFSAQAMGIDLSVGQIFNIMFVAALVTSAGSGVPGAGIMSLMIVASAVGIPLEIVVMVGGFYRFFDMGTTTLNCLGDLSATVLIDRMEKKREQRLALCD